MLAGFLGDAEIPLEGNIKALALQIVRDFPTRGHLIIGSREVPTPRLRQQLTPLPGQLRMLRECGYRNSGPTLDLKLASQICNVVNIRAACAFRDSGSCPSENDDGYD